MASALSVTWLGHAAFLLVLPNGKRVLLDPWISNPKCPSEYSRADAFKTLDLILVSHGHGDHLGEVVPIAQSTSAPVVCVADMADHLAGKGVKDVRGMNVGGTQDVAGVSVTMTQAIHSSSIVDADRVVYLGVAAGFVLRAPGTPTIYFAGDTALFGDMKVIAELYRPEIGFLPIGDHYTMGPEAAAIAAKWLGVKRVVPMHWGTFPLLHGTPAQLRSHLPKTGIDVVDIMPGQTVTIG